MLNDRRRRLAFRLFYGGTVAAGVALLGWLLAAHPVTHGRWSDWLVFLAVLLFADAKLAESQGNGGGRILSSRSLDLSMVAVFGPLVAAGVEVVQTLVRGFVLRTVPPVKAVFNAAMLALAAGGAGLVYHALPWHDRYGGPLFLLPLLAALMTYAFLNAVIVTTITALHRGTPLREVWYRDFSMGIGASILELPFAAMVVLLYEQAGAWTVLVYLPIVWMVHQLTHSYREQRKAHLTSIAVLATTLEADEPYTHGHSYRVSQYAIRIGRAMGMSPRELEILEIGGLLHDVGKIAITNDIVCKPGRLTEEEFAVMAEHPAIGARIVEQIDYYADAVDLVRHHHERPDGKGYPDGLKGDEISLGASILMVCDAFDAMTSDRSYRKALPIERALAELRRYRGTQFSAEVVDTVLALHERGEFDIIPDTEVQRVIHQIQRGGTSVVAQPARKAEPEVEVHEI